MLKGLDPLLSPDLLWVLAAMGHGDDLALVDANHPAEAIARATLSGRLIVLPGVTMARAARGILSVFPLDGYVPDPVRRMEVVGDPAAIPAVQGEVQAEIDHAEGRPLLLQGIERFAFYDAARKAFAVVQVGDPRPYGCFLLRKGVIAGDVP
ncbi:fucose-binding protein [Azospirillum sp. TSH100]|uniref:RbsD/FucU family protein n=1 Tax=Azospirillum sp. TSH100 TaxID=652764 RepID=UPI000D619C1B|nr:RbsD/FucU domain-containing protein [Azospirillum sp. TSH100]PWC90084.1 fucose-binding protein [Azospirillum sp. TSH100]QCG90649.1 fucose-binding protein [Azospirillum sp. TSH100]